MTSGFHAWPETAFRWVAVAFARRTGQPLLDVLRWHPRDMETWMALDAEQAAKEEQEERFEALHQERRDARGGVR